MFTPSYNKRFHLRGQGGSILKSKPQKKHVHKTTKKKEKDKKCRFFTQKEHPAAQKPEVLNENLKTVLTIGILKKNPDLQNNREFFLKRKAKMEVLHEKLKTVLPMAILKKKSRPPTSTNF